MGVTIASPLASLEAPARPLPEGPLAPVLLPCLRFDRDGLRTLAGRPVDLAPDLAALLPRLGELDEREQIALEEAGVIARVPAAIPEGPAGIGGIVVLAPHVDDAALSAGGLLARLAAEGWRCESVVIFSRQTFQTGLRVPPEDLDRVAAEEETLAGRILGFRPRFLGLAGAQDRHGLGLRETLGWSETDVAARQEREIAELAGRLAEEARGAALVLAPLGLGGHLDHVITALAARRAFPEEALRHWEDLPYAAALPSVGPCPSVLVGARPCVRAPFDITPALDRKRRALRVYRTRLRGPQIDLALGWARREPGRPPSEALWS
jgi:LmbE family N-acetylglucosaminyl deacetylase